jgi:UDP-N-acetylglucosamine--N-acetylmuramyl-(pentapeptide) pyrophosphoryl-undecaprenol N-acetylglucosamine transferase
VHNHSLNIIITGGGTGGHLFPGIAIAEAFAAKDSKNRILFVNTGNPFEISVLSERGFSRKSITAKAIKGRGIFQKAGALSKIPKGIYEAIGILKKFKPDLVVGMGSYSSGPMIMGAWILGIKTVIHEQNIFPGITNRVLAPFADRIYVSFENTKELLVPEKIHVTGNPVRKDILKCQKGKEPLGIENKRQDRPFSILVLGGSQGAHGINMAVMDALKDLEEKEKYFFVHQAGALDEKRVKYAYMIHGITASVQSFFNDMSHQYENADLVICRAGATTVAEIAAIGKGVIFVPYPFAADNHQVLNAQALVNKGGAEMILEKDLSGKVLAEKIRYYASHPELLERMAKRSKELCRPDAAETIVDDCYRLIGKG